VVAQCKKNSKHTRKLVTAKQEGKPKQPPYKLKPPPNVPMEQMKDSKFGWKKKPSPTCDSCGFKGHVSSNYYYPMREDKIRWKQIPYHKPQSQVTSQFLERIKSVYYAWKINLRRKL
jgi:hypothetical protein